MEIGIYKIEDGIERPTEKRKIPSEVMDLDNVPAPIGGEVLWRCMLIMQAFIKVELSEERACLIFAENVCGCGGWTLQKVQKVGNWRNSRPAASTAPTAPHF